MPDWSRGRMNATVVMVGQGATALGGAIWGLAAHDAEIVPTFLVAAGFAFVIMIIVRIVPAFRLSIDFTKSLTFESAPVTIFSQGLDLTRPHAPQHRPPAITAQFQNEPTPGSDCGKLSRGT